MKKIQIFQIYYQDTHKSDLDTAFTPYSNKGVSDNRLEFAVFDKLHHSTKTKNLSYWGAVSWRFQQKTRVEGQQLLDYVSGKLEFDIFYMNASPMNEALFDNCWMQGEVSHPGLIDLAQKVFQCAGLPQELIYEISHSQQYSTANYFVGNRKFWDLYIPFINKVLTAADQKLPAKYKKILHANADPKGLHHGATFVPFLIERLFGVFMKLHADELKFHKIRLLHLEKRLDAHLAGLRLMKDKAIETKSPWLLKIWRNYRNLYLSGYTKPEWREQHLPMMNGDIWLGRSKGPAVKQSPSRSKKSK